MRAIGVVFVATAIGCSGSVYTPLPGFSPSSTLLFFVLGGREEVLAIHAFDGSARPDPILLALEPGTTQRVLEYDAPLAVIMDASATGVADPVAVSDDAWRLPVPKSSADLVGEAFEPGDPSALAPWLATFRVPRPPCPAAPKIRPIEGLPPGDDVTFALPFGDGALVGLVAGGLFRVSKSTARAEPFPVLPAGPAAVDHASPFGFLDGDQVVVGWGHGVEPTLELRSIDREGNVTDRSITGGFPGIHRLGGLVSGRFGSERTVMGRTLRIAPPSLAIEDLCEAVHRHADRHVGAETRRLVRLEQETRRGLHDKIDLERALFPGLDDTCVLEEHLARIPDKCAPTATLRQLREKAARDVRARVGEQEPIAGRGGRRRAVPHESDEVVHARVAIRVEDAALQAVRFAQDDARARRVLGDDDDFSRPAREGLGLDL